MSKHKNPASLTFRQIDLRDWLMLGDAARELTVAAGRKHRQHFTFISEALTWRSLHARMRAGDLYELRDETIFRAFATSRQTLCQCRLGCMSLTLGQTGEFLV